MSNGEGEEPQRELALPEQSDGEPLDQEKSAGRDLVEQERLREQMIERKADDVAGEQDLVEPEGRVRRECPDTERDADDDERRRQPRQEALRMLKRRR